jgi:hypothetical protein
LSRHIIPFKSLSPGQTPGKGRNEKDDSAPSKKSQGEAILSYDPADV